jgi:hypothetical protein
MRYLDEQRIAKHAAAVALARYGLSKTANYFFEALRARPELFTNPVLYGALPGAAVGGIYDIAMQRRNKDAPHDWGASLRRVGTGAVIGAGLGAAYGGFKTHRFGAQQKKLDSIFQEAPTVIYSQALDNKGQDLASDYRGLRAPYSEEKYLAGAPSSLDVVMAPSDIKNAVTFKSPSEGVTQSGPRAFHLQTAGDLRDIAGRKSPLAIAINAPRGADDAWVDAQIDLIKKHQDYLLTKLDPNTQIPDSWRQGLIYDPQDLERARAFIKERLRKIR